MKKYIIVNFYILLKLNSTKNSRNIHKLYNFCECDIQDLTKNEKKTKCKGISIHTLCTINIHICNCNVNMLEEFY